MNELLLAVWDRVYSTNPAYSTERGFVESVCVDIAHLLSSRRAGNDITADIECLATVTQVKTRATTIRASRIQ